MAVSTPINPDAGKRLLQNCRKEIDVLDSYISYLDTGKGDKVVLFLHGNPTSSYLWRNIIPHVQPLARCLAPDHIGMGSSGKISNCQYRFVDLYKYFDAWVKKMNFPSKIHFVVQDWGSAIGFHWCNNNRDKVASITYFEAIVKSFKNWNDFPDLCRQEFQILRSEKGEEMILEKNMFITHMLPLGILRELSQEEIDEYTKPFQEKGENRRPTLSLPREMPIADIGPADVVKFADEYYEWLSHSDALPKLFIHVEPGFFSPRIHSLVQDWPNNKIVTLRGHHFAQEDSPHDIGDAIKTFLMAIK